LPFFTCSPTCGNSTKGTSLAFLDRAQLSNGSDIVLDGDVFMILAASDLHETCWTFACAVASAWERKNSHSSNDRLCLVAGARDLPRGCGLRPR
jgi:hypothetical protein